MEQIVFTIRENVPLTVDVYRMVLDGDTGAITAPGQFVNVQVPGFTLRRPISVCDWAEGTLTLVYKVVGAGTAALEELVPGDRLDILTGLGNGFDTAKSGQKPLLIGGGVGTPPLYALCKKLLAEGKEPTVLLGFRSEREVILAEEFKALGAEVCIATEDGSVGTKGFVTAVMSELTYSYLYACGPIPMLKAVDGAAQTSGQLSFEERMGCGFGVCMGCSWMTKNGSKRICTDGPVLEREELLWDA